MAAPIRLREMREPKPAHPAPLETVTLPKAVLAARLCAHPERTRYAMDGVLLERADGQCRAIATDGKRLLALEWADTTEGGGGGDVFTVLPSAMLEAAAKGATKACDSIPATLNGKVTLAVPTKAGETRLEALPVEGHFPPYREVFPADREEIVLAINVELLHGLAKALHQATGTLVERGDLSVRLRIARDKPAESAIMVEAIGATDGAVRGVGLLMPLNIRE
jgi:DNA polymerase III sliding clamp (beta) subunit (PCNA family)